MRQLKAEALCQAFRDPASWVILAVDLSPIVAVFQLGWGAAALVFLYWLENLVLGATTVLRLAAVMARNGLSGMIGFIAFGALFTFHYGMFCFVHSVFLMAFSEMSSESGVEDFNPFSVARYALQSGEGMVWFVAAILALQVFLFLRDFLLAGQYLEADPMTEMGKPYERVIILHLALFAGFGLLIFMGEPLMGVLALVLVRAAWGVMLSMRRQTENHGPPLRQS